MSALENLKLFAKEPHFWGDGTKGLQLWFCGKLNSTHHCKLWRCRILCTEAPQNTSRHYTRYFLSLMYCGLCTAAAINLKVASPQYMSRSTRDPFFFLVYCGASCTASATVDIDAPQFESFYTVPFFEMLSNLLPIYKYFATHLSILKAKFFK